MRRYMKQQLLEIISSMEKSINSLKKSIQNQKTDEIISILTGVQEMAIRIGTEIETTEGVGHETVKRLEDYCELLWKCSQSGDKEEQLDIWKQLKADIGEVNNLIHSTIKEQYLILFLPYNASMWDSLESIWQAAMEDDSCEAIVVPIPYFDKNSDGSCAQMHYEGGLLPDYVTVTDWHSIDLQNLHPEIIFFHNPYDDHNHATSVHPDFYSKELKKHTELLVYIPYFVTADDTPEHLIATSGVIHADKVIVQSDRVRESYMHIFTGLLCNGEKAKDMNFCNSVKKIAASKFLALGSPKIDKIDHTNQNCINQEDIPQEWSSLIWQGDSRKIVILYNTSIQNLLNEKHGAIRKIRNVLEVFKKRNDIALLWRPHPLNEAAMSALVPEVLMEYKEIISVYQKEGWGIYDDTTELHRTIRIADAYYGDGGSLIPMFQVTGKPLLMQNFNIDNKLTNHNKVYDLLAFENIYQEDDVIWVTPYMYNGLYKISKLNWKAEYLGAFPGEKMDGWRLYSSIIKHQNKLYFAPGSANEIGVFDILTNALFKIPIEIPQTLHKTKYFPEAKFFASVQYKKWIFFVACSYPAFIRYDLETQELKYYSDWVEKLEKYSSTTEDVFFRQQACVRGNQFVIAACNSNAVVVFDMDDCVSQVFEVGSKGCRYSGICYDGETYWLSPRGVGPVVNWDPKKLVFVEYHDFPLDYNPVGLSFWNINYAGGYVWLFPNRANLALKIDVPSKIMSVADVFQQECAFNASEGWSLQENYIMSHSDGNKLYAHTGKSNQFMEYEVDRDRMEYHNIIIDSRGYRLIKSSLCKKAADDVHNLADCVYQEDNENTLEDFLDYISTRPYYDYMKPVLEKQQRLIKENFNNSDGTAGVKILRTMKTYVN